MLKEALGEKPPKEVVNDFIKIIINDNILHGFSDFDSIKDYLKK